MGILLVLASCDDPAATRPAPALASTHDVAAAAASLPAVSEADLERARRDLVRAADPEAGARRASKPAAEGAVAAASEAAAALRPYLSSDAADRVARVAPALAAGTVRPGH